MRETEDQIIATIEIALNTYVAISPVPIHFKLEGVTSPLSINFWAPKNFGISESASRYEIKTTPPKKAIATSALFVAFLSEIVLMNSITTAPKEAIMSRTYDHLKFVDIQDPIDGSDLFSSRLDSKEMIRKNEIPKITHNNMFVILVNFIFNYFFVLYLTRISINEIEASSMLLTMLSIFDTL